MISPEQTRKLRARIVTRRNERIDRLIDTIKVREVLAWDIEGAYLLNYSFSYIDPASRRWRKHSTDAFWKEKPLGAQLRDARDFSKRMIARELERTCGIENAIPMHMELPRAVISAQMV